MYVYGEYKLNDARDSTVSSTGYWQIEPNYGCHRHGVFGRYGAKQRRSCHAPLPRPSANIERRATWRITFLQLLNGTEQLSWNPQGLTPEINGWSPSLAMPFWNRVGSPLRGTSLNLCMQARRPAFLYVRRSSCPMQPNHCLCWKNAHSLLSDKISASHKDHFPQRSQAEADRKQWRASERGTHGRSIFWISNIWSNTISDWYTDL